MGEQAQWLREFQAESAAIFGDPFFACLAEAIASVECGWDKVAT